MLTLRPYQQAAITSIYGYFQNNKGNPLVVIPTAGGKSLVMAAFIEGVLKAWPDQRILIVTHVRELIAQNHAEMIGLWPDAPAGIYSAGLGKREAQAKILFAGIQSIHRRAQEIGHTDLVLIDDLELPAALLSKPSCALELVGVLACVPDQIAGVLDFDQRGFAEVLA